MASENTYIIILCGAVLVIALHMLSNNKKTTLYIGANRPVTKNNGNSQIKIDLQGNKSQCGGTGQEINVGESNQVILHKYIFEKLQEIANEDYGVKNLTCQYEIQEYSRFTITKKLKEQIHKQIMFPILVKLNATTNMHFEVNNIFHVTKKIAKNGSACLYLIEVFIYDKNNFFEKKIVVDVHHDIYGQNYHINSINYSTNDYLCNEIYKPRDTLIDRDHNINSNLIVQKTSQPCKEQCETLYTQGKHLSKLDYTTLNRLNNYNSYTEKSEEYNKKQLPHKAVELKQHGMKAWPCGETGNLWDEYGVLVPKGHENTCGKDNVCLGNYDSSYQGTPLDTYFHPSSYESRK